MSSAPPRSEDVTLHVHAARQRRRKSSSETPVRRQLRFVFSVPSYSSDYAAVLIRNVGSRGELEVHTLMLKYIVARTVRLQRLYANQYALRAQ